MSSWSWPTLVNTIAESIPYLKNALNALLKMNPASIADVPTDAKRLNTTSTGSTLENYNGTAWSSVGKLLHDVDSVDGYHAQVNPAASTVAVRNTDGVLQDSITGNAATATAATALSQVNPINMGGTGASTADAARTNLGVPPTSHKTTATTYGVGDSTNYGHLKLTDTASTGLTASSGVAATPKSVAALKETIDTEVVHLSGAETITGVKTVSSDGAIVQKSTATASSAPSSAIETKLISASSTDNETMAYVAAKKNTSGVTSANLVVNRGGYTGTIGVNVSQSGGNVTTYAPTPAITDSSTQIATTAFVKAFGGGSRLSITNGVLNVSDTFANSFVSSSESGTISGDKYFTGNICVEGTNMTKALVSSYFSTPSNILAYMYSGLTSGGERTIALVARENTSGGSQGVIGVKKENGTSGSFLGYVTCPPQHSTNTSHIATTGWVTYEAMHNWSDTAHFIWPRRGAAQGQQILTSIQTGYSGPFPSQGSYIDITFNAPFTYMSVAIATPDSGGGGATGDDAGIEIRNLSTTGMTLVNCSSATQYARWMVLGTIINTSFSY